MAAPEAQSNPMLPLVQDFRAARDALGARPSTEQVEEAYKEIGRVNEELVRDLEEITKQTAAPGVDHGVYTALLQVKKDVAQTKAATARAKSQSVVDLYERFRHYDRVVMLAEGVVVGDAKPAQLLDAAVALSPLKSEPANGAMKPALFGISEIHEEPQLTARTEKPPVHQPSRFMVTGKVSDDTFGELSDDSMKKAKSATVQVDEPIISNRGGVRKQSLLSASMVSSGQSEIKPAAAPSSSSTADKVRAILSDGTASASEPSEFKLNPKLLRMIENAAASKSKELDVSGRHFSSPLTYFPESLGILDFLVELDLSSNALLMLPESIGNLLYLSRLDASCNKLVELPQTIGRLPRLQVLDVHHNCLSEIPSSLGNCEALEELNLGFNSLAAIPEAMGLLLSLRVLKIHLNKLTYLPRKIGKLGNLVELDVHYNALESLPESIGQLTSLQKLNVSANHFALKTLPESLGQLTGLVELDISENHIKVMPKGLVHLTQLQVLRMDGNPWQFPPQAVVEKGLKAVMDHLSHAPVSGSKNVSGQSSGAIPIAPQKSARSGLRRLMGAFSLPGSNFPKDRSM